MVDNEDSKSIAALESRLGQLERMLSDLLSAQTANSAQSAGEAEEEFDLYYPNVEAWVTQEFAIIYAKAIGGEFRWCSRWWEHVEAVSRFEALWRVWERSRLDPAYGMANYYRDYLDLGLNAIVGPRGPFSRCSPERHEPLRPLPCIPAPKGHWDWPGESQEKSSFEKMLQTGYEWGTTQSIKMPNDN